MGYMTQSSIYWMVFIECILFLLKILYIVNDVTLRSNNCKYACTANNANSGYSKFYDIDSAISYNGIEILPISNSNNLRKNTSSTPPVTTAGMQSNYSYNNSLIPHKTNNQWRNITITIATDTNTSAAIQENELSNIRKCTIHNDLIEECKSFLERVYEKRRQKSGRLDKTNFLKTYKDEKYKKGTTLIIGDSIFFLVYTNWKIESKKNTTVPYWIYIENKSLSKPFC